MGVLKSQLFTEGDTTTIKKLEDCATGQPNQAMSHFRRGHVNAKGEHIVKVQKALQNVRQTRPELDIPDFAVNGVYDEQFAKAVYVYKQKKDIRNYANKIDDIIGIKTLRSLDSDNTNRPHEDPPPKPKNFKVFPKSFGDCVPESLCPFSTEFDVTLLFGGSAGEVVEGSKYYFTIRDTQNGLSVIYESIGGGLGFSQSPVSFGDGGGPTHYSLSSNESTRVTDFNGLFIAGFTPYNSADLSATMVQLQYRSSRGKNITTPFKKFDTGAVAIKGASGHINKLTLLTGCRGGRGAVKKVLLRRDVDLQFF